eukprot:771575-Rhodomonas_salina.2
MDMAWDALLPSPTVPKVTLPKKAEKPGYYSDQAARYSNLLYSTITDISVIPPDDLTDEAIISDHSRLLQYHHQHFRQEVRSYGRVQLRTPTVVGKRRGGIGIDITTHSFMDTAPPSLDPSLITIVSRSI